MTISKEKKEDKDQEPVTEEEIRALLRVIQQMEDNSGKYKAK